MSITNFLILAFMLIICVQPNAAVRSAFLSDPLDGVVGIIVPGFALLYTTYFTASIVAETT